MKIDRSQPVVPYGCEQCPNQKTRQLDKGYSYLTVFLISAFMAFQSIDLKFNKTDQWVFATKEVPLTVVLPGLVVIAGILGLDTSAIALGIGKALSSGKELS
jgi:hypothetical protein